ncbi:MAG: LysM peptidoglycan-binding domain-containing protein, partial [Chitinispirillales bacterium]|nr:LysM peptidoglycan-binding domain-containing protein [Chitinispirillales bacterium]
NDLAEANNITNSSKIYVGQVLRIPTGPGSTGPTVAAKPKAVAVADTAKAKAAAVDTAKAKAASVDTAKAKAVSVDTAKVKKVAVVDTAKPKTVAVDTAKTKAASVDTIKVKKVAVADTAKAKAVSVDTAKAKAVVIDTAKAKAASVDTAKVKKVAVADTAKPKAVAIDTAKAKAMLADTAKPKAVTEPALSASIPAPTETAKTAKIDPGVKPAPDTRFDADAYDLGMTVATGGSSVRVRVSVDETIGHFAEWMRVYTADIRRANNIPDGGTPQLGAFVSIPISSSTNIKKFEVNRLQYHMAIEEDFFARYDVTDFEQRKVKPGDNLWRICSGAQIPMWLLKKYNRGVNFYALQPGNSLWIPKAAAKGGAAAETGDAFAPAVSESEEAEGER